MKQERICLDCGVTYHFDSKCKKGASTRYCSSCTKKHSRRKSESLMLNNAGGKCRACGYNKCAAAFVYLPSKGELFKTNKPSSRQAKIEWAADKIALCLNCNKALSEGSIEMQIFDSAARPVKVAFYTEHAMICMGSYQAKTDVVVSDAEEVEILKSYEKIPEEPGAEMRRANAKVVE